MASFTKHIPAGGEGKIAITVKTDGYGGRKLEKTSVVLSNDPENPQKELIITGFVEPFVNIQPKGLVRLVGLAGSDISKGILIIPEKKYPFKISRVIAQSEENITFELTERQPEGTGYLLTVKNKKAEKGRYYDTLIIDTTSAIRPTFYIRIFGDIREKINAP